MIPKNLNFKLFMAFMSTISPIVRNQKILHKKSTAVKIKKALPWFSKRFFMKEVKRSIHPFSLKYLGSTGTLH